MFRLFVTSIAVQEERQRNKEKNENEVESTSNSQTEMPIERIYEAEIKVEQNTENDNSQVSKLPLRLPMWFYSLPRCPFFTNK